MRAEYNILSYKNVKQILNQLKKIILRANRTTNHEIFEHALRITVYIVIGVFCFYSHNYAYLC